MSEKSKAELIKTVQYLTTVLAYCIAVAGGVIIGTLMGLNHALGN